MDAYSYENQASRGYIKEAKQGVTDELP